MREYNEKKIKENDDNITLCLNDIRRDILHTYIHTYLLIYTCTCTCNCTCTFLALVPILRDAFAPAPTHLNKQSSTAE